jgi:CII-binding regulator of phage lambda lysogenization HflD
MFSIREESKKEIDNDFEMSTLRNTMMHYQSKLDVATGLLDEISNKYEQLQKKHDELQTKHELLQRKERKHRVFEFFRMIDTKR